MSSGEIICRFCLNNLSVHKRNYDVDENISRLFHDVTGIELNKSRNCPKITCELCIRSLQHFSALKNQLIENQYQLLRTVNTANSSKNQATSIKNEPEIEITSFSDDDEDPLAKKIKLERKSQERVVAWSNSEDLLDELLPIAPDQECLHCDAKLPNTFALKQHIKTLHADQDVSEQKINCPYKNCQSSFKKFSSLVEHKKMHQFEGQISCDTCGKVCISKDQLRAHQKYHQKPKYICSKCNMSFYESQQLKNHHLNKHENVRNFKCPMCDKTYFKNSHLSRHVKVTHQKQTIQCNVPNCDRVYTRRERVIVHICKQHAELTTHEMDLYVEAIRNTPYNYGDDNSSNSAFSNVDDNQDDNLSDDPADA